MRVVWKNTKFKGVRFYESLNKRNGIRKDRNYYIRYQFDGKRYEECVGWESDGITAEDAALKLAEIRKAQKTGEGEVTLAEKKEKAKVQKEAKKKEKEQIEKESITFSHVWKIYYYPQALLDKKTSSMEREEKIYRKWIKPNIGNITLKNISPFTIEKLKKKMADDKLSPRSIQYCLAVIRQVFTYSRKMGIYKDESPTSKVNWPKVDNAKLRYITRDEAKQLFLALKAISQQVYEISLISLNCGLRFDEIVSLEWQDINLVDNFLVIRDPKNSSSRVAYMTSQVKEMFNQKKKRNPNDLVFRSSIKKKIERISRTFDRTVTDLKLNDNITDRRMKLTFHTLRHSFASFLAMEGAPLLAIKNALGHKTLAMAMRYSHLAPDAGRETARIIEQALKLSEESIPLNNAG